jgi:light-regulated signal transduction histidine kinase (bacteriophytochrome)
LVKRQVDLERLVRTVVEELRPQHAHPGLRIQIGTLPSAWADPSLLQQVVVNLLSNAFKFIQNRESALVEIGCLPQPDETAYFVRDNGVGFDMAHASKLFAPFQRLHRSEDYEGTGVGLSIVQRIVERHGGRIWAESAPDKGATFFFTLEAPKPGTTPKGHATGGP